MRSAKYGYFWLQKTNTATAVMPNSMLQNMDVHKPMGDVTVGLLLAYQPIFQLQPNIILFAKFIIFMGASTQIF